MINRQKARKAKILKFVFHVFHTETSYDVLEKDNFNSKLCCAMLRRLDLDYAKERLNIYLSHLFINEICIA